MDGREVECRDAVERMERCIREHIKEPITQGMLARAAGYSQDYSARIFKEATGMPPFAYIRALRLSQSALILGQGGAKVVDVALDFVFDSHEGFTRAFSRQFGVPPRDFVKNPRPIPMFQAAARPHPSLTTRQKGAMFMSNPNAIFVQVVDRPARKLIIKRGKSATHYFEYCEEVGCDVWQTLCGVKEALYEPIGMWMPENFRPEGTSVYTQGVEVPLDFSGEVPEGFELFELPACRMMIFQGPPYDDEKFEEAIDELWQQTENFNPEIYGYRWADADAPKFQLAPMGYRGYIEGRPVCEINKA